jgi:hypothetical protein
VNKSMSSIEGLCPETPIPLALRLVFIHALPPRALLNARLVSRAWARELIRADYWARHWWRVCERFPWFGVLETELGTRPENYWRRFVEWSRWSITEFGCPQSWTFIHAAHAKHERIESMKFEYWKEGLAYIVYRCGARVALKIEAHTPSLYDVDPYKKKRRRRKKHQPTQTIRASLTHTCSLPSHTGHQTQYASRKTFLAYLHASFQNVIHERPRVYVDAYGLLSPRVSSSWLFFED